MDDQQIAVCVCASSDANVGIIRIKDQIAGLGFAPRNIRAVAVLHGRAAASASFPGDSGAGVWKQYAGEAVSDSNPVPRLGQDNIRH